MKAREIAIAPGSVFAIESTGGVRFIERGPDGFWGRWLDTGTSARHIAHGGNVVGVVGLDGRVSALQRVPASSWTTWDLQATGLSSTHLPGVGPVLFARSESGMVWYIQKSGPESGWAAWEALDGPVERIQASVIPGGGLVVFGLREGAVWHRWQDRPSSPWSGWTELGKPPEGAKDLRVTTIRRGGLAVFAIGEDSALYHRWQDSPFAQWGVWERIGESALSISVTKAPAGGLAVFATGTDDGVRYTYQKKPFGSWSPWLALEGAAKSIEGQTSYADGLEIFTIGRDDEVRHRWCNRVDWPWMPWMPLDHEATLSLYGP